MTKLEKRIREAKNLPLLGFACYDFNPTFVELAGIMGGDVIWIEMEHMGISFPDATNLCRIASGMGMLTLIRVPNAHRDNVLRAAECGPDILDLPMANTPEIITEFVDNARYAPEGNRGFFGSSRAVKYSLGGHIVDIQKQVNEDLCLLFQIETKTAVERADELCSVPGANGIFIGHGDLSVSYGLTGQTTNPVVEEAITSAFETAKRHNKLITMAMAPENLSKWVEKGLQVAFIAGDNACLKAGMAEALRKARSG